ncbi:DUF4136 domain-containing protein [Pigmentiphaga soli]
MTERKCNFSSVGWWRGTAWAARLLAVMLLAGCAATVPARVTTFQQWPQDAVGATWALDSTPAQRDSLEYRQYADMIRSAIGPIGLVEARDGQKPRFLVSFTYGTEPVQVRVQRPAYDPFYGPWGPYAFGGWGRPWRGGGFGYMWGPPYPSTWTETTIDASRSTLKVEIRDTAHGNAKVYESTAVNHGSGDLPEVMPYLVRAIFDRFPDTNGQVREIDYEVPPAR